MKNKVLIQTMLALILAVLAGWLTGPERGLFGVPFLKIYNLIGQLFLNALTLVVVPLVSSSIITAAARMGSDDSIGSLGKKTFGFFALSLFLAVCVGLVSAIVIEPGKWQPFTTLLAQDAQVLNLTSSLEEGAFHKLEQIILKFIPSNIFAAAVQGQMLGLIIFSLLFGYFLTKVETQPSAVLLGFFKGVFQVMMKITHLVMKALPIGVFGLVAKVVATSGIDSFKSVAVFFIAFVVGFLIYGLAVMPLLLKFKAKISPWAYIKAISPALLTAFSTSSSAASLPITMDCIEKRAGVSNRVCGFVMPLGITLNMSGTALFQAVAAVFIAQAYALPLSMSTVFLIGAMSFLTSIGVAGIPSASLVSLVITLSAVGLPAEGIGLIMAVERISDMFRTTANIYGNACCSVLVARAEGEDRVLISGA